MFEIQFSKDKLFATASAESMYSVQNATNRQGENEHLQLMLTNDERDYFDTAVYDAANDLAYTVEMLFDGLELLEVPPVPFEQDESTITLRGILQNGRTADIIYKDMQTYLVKHVLRSWFETRNNAALIQKYEAEYDKAERVLLVRIQRKEQRITYTHY